MTLGATLEIFTKFGLSGLSRWGHVLAGITWIGLLYYFNFVQVPAFAQMDPAARADAMDKLAWRALWWFRWSSVLTVLTGLMILGFNEQFKNSYFKTAPGISIATGILLALTMFGNVWSIIWPKQQIVIGNARTTAAGGAADPNAPAAARRGLLASRMNVIYSIPMLLFMVGTSHFFIDSAHFKLAPSGSNRAVYWIIVLVIWLAFELNAVGVIGGTDPGPLKWPFESHKNAIITGFALTVVYYALWEIIFRV
jgi:uncharacterized membrane protein